MPTKIGIRREDLYQWERRAPVIPEDARELRLKHGIEVVVQSSAKRVFTEGDYREAGIDVAESLADCPIILGIKEVPIPALEKGKTYVFFSHTIKGQAHNMPMLARVLELGCTLIDYEKVTDERGRRLIFFGNYAGLVGMIDTLWALGRRLRWEGIESPFEAVEHAVDYPNLARAKLALGGVGERIREEGLPREIAPFVVGFAGYGNVSRGAQEMLDLLPVEEIGPQELPTLARRRRGSNRVVYKVVFKEEHLVEPREPGRPFELEEYYRHPERYRGVFERHLPHLDVLVNGVYWEAIYPRLVTKDWLKETVRQGRLRLRVIGDISCDVEGAIQCTVKATEPDNPVYVYDPIEGRAVDGVAGNGPVVLAVDILPTELPRDASTYFSGVVKPFIPPLAGADFGRTFEDCELPPPLRRAVIAYRGKLTGDYRYLDRFLSERARGRS
ncbi:MAG: bifunctional lysine ketoglutarate reductase /saccharopine dehydrogenase family protein [Candidatus Bipolaricaulota bacterium]|nr:bifunctional lysine ketoglutarate reductase /saccharopine dehydrogenase family protein [Candidatus Bipolaricaulota bacterium]